MADDDDTLPPEVAGWIGRVVVRDQGQVAADAGTFRLFAAAVEDANPRYRETEGGNAVAPPALASAWTRPDPWTPGGSGEEAKALALHFMLKDALALPRGIVTGGETELHAPVRPGDRIDAEQRLDHVGPIRTNRLGTGRNWTISTLYRRAADGALVAIETLSFFGFGEPHDRDR